MTECQRRSIRVPDQMSIAGFGNYDIGAVCVPTLTTINPFPVEIGRKAAELIMRIQDRRETGAQTVRITPHLLLRQSSQ